MRIYAIGESKCPPKRFQAGVRLIDGNAIRIGFNAALALLDSRKRKIDPDGIAAEKLAEADDCTYSVAALVLNSDVVKMVTLTARD